MVGRVDDKGDRVRLCVVRGPVAAHRRRAALIPHLEERRVLQAERADVEAERRQHGARIVAGEAREDGGLARAVEAEEDDVAVVGGGGVAHWLSAFEAVDGRAVY